MKGTYKTLDIIRDEDLIGVPVTSEPEVKVVKIDGQPLKLDQDEKEHEEVEQDSGDDDKLIIDTFIVSPKVRSLKDFLTSSIQQNMQNGDYLKLVGKATRTDCAIMNRVSHK